MSLLFTVHSDSPYGGLQSPTSLHLSVCNLLALLSSEDSCFEPTKPAHSLLLERLVLATKGCVRNYTAQLDKYPWLQWLPKFDLWNIFVLLWSWKFALQKVPATQYAFIACEWDWDTDCTVAYSFYLQAKIRMKYRISYHQSGQEVVEMGEVSNFPVLWPVPLKKIYYIVL